MDLSMKELPFKEPVGILKPIGYFKSTSEYMGVGGIDRPVLVYRGVDNLDTPKYNVYYVVEEKTEEAENVYELEQAFLDDFTDLYQEEMSYYNS
ncbi:hypothetical protein EalM132_00166 [Exiguobacterium phage vB_EalM-132]|nr:hypothetical protein EalM132_00166 [Exiguobacterium phage vB_EalM-132]